MIRYLTVNEVLEIYRQMMQQSGGAIGIRDMGGLESAVAQPRMSFDTRDLYPTLVEKASALAFSLIQNHPFIDGNKRIGHAAMEIFLVLNDQEIEASTDEQVNVILQIASSQMNRDTFTEWLRNHVKQR